MERSRRSRIVSIPVHFVQSEQTQSASALKIQKAVRGFLVRKSVKQIASIMQEVEEIERSIDKVKEVGIGEKERMRVNETLMSLLLKLDSVRGICCGVRDCRKRVIKKAIALQEKVDSIADYAVSDPIVDNQPDDEPKTIHCMTEDDRAVNSSMTGCDECEGINPEMDEDVEAMNPEVDEDVEAMRRRREGKDDGREEEEERERKRSRELLEKMVEENEKLVGMVTELAQKNDMQTRLLNSLAQRVEMLEKTVVCEKLARMKKKKRHGVTPNNHN